VSEPTRLDDADVDALQPVVAVEGGELRLSWSGSPRARVVANALTLRRVHDLARLAGGVLVDGAVRATDSGGYSIDGPSVVVWDVSDAHVSISCRALRSLLARAVAATLEHRDELASGVDTDTWASLESLLD
jgi:hypothetical protein